MLDFEGLVEEIKSCNFECFKIKDIAKYENRGVDKKINDDELPVKLVNYMDVYRNSLIDSYIPTMNVTTPKKKLEECSIQKYDILVTPSSETKDDICHTSVCVEDIPNAVYSYHIARIRLNNPNYVTARYISYLFESPNFRDYLNKFVFGVTRFTISKTNFENLTIWLPPFYIQEKIVHFLDVFTALITALRTEAKQSKAKQRKEQYIRYRNSLLNFDEKYINSFYTQDDIENIQYLKIKDISTFRRGSFPQPYTDRSYYGGIDAKPFVQVADIGNHFRLNEITNKTISKEAQPLSVFVPKDTLVISIQGTIGRVALTQYDSYVDRTIMIFNENPELIDKSYFAFQSQKLFEEKAKYARGAVLKTITKEELSEFEIPVPSLSVQRKIVELLNNLTTYSNDISSGLPAEIQAREKQYQYYLEALLNPFKESI